MLTRPMQSIINRLVTKRRQEAARRDGCGVFHLSSLKQRDAKNKSFPCAFLTKQEHLGVRIPGVYMCSNRPRHVAEYILLFLSRIPSR